MPDIIGAPTWHDTIPTQPNGASANETAISDPVQLLQDNIVFLSEARPFQLTHSVGLTIDVSDTDSVVYQFPAVQTYGIDVNIMVTATINPRLTAVGPDGNWAATIAVFDATFNEIQWESAQAPIYVYAGSFAANGAFDLPAGSYRFGIMGHRLTPDTSTHLAVPAPSMIIIAGCVFPKRGT